MFFERKITCLAIKSLMSSRNIVLLPHSQNVYSLFLFTRSTFQGGGIPRRSAPTLQMIREEVCFSYMDLESSFTHSSSNEWQLPLSSNARSLYVSSVIANGKWASLYYHMQEQIKNYKRLYCTKKKAVPFTTCCRPFWYDYQGLYFVILSGLCRQKLCPAELSIIYLYQVSEDGKYCLVLVFEAKALQLSDFERRQVELYITLSL